MELTLFGIALMPIIAGVIELLKKIGLPKDLAPYLAGLLAAGGWYLAQYVNWHPEIGPQVELWLNILVIFLGISGSYAVGKYAKKKLIDREVER